MHSKDIHKINLHLHVRWMNWAYTLYYNAGATFKVHKNLLKESKYVKVHLSPYIKWPLQMNSEKLILRWS
jgi:hypothetical protein